MGTELTVYRKLTISPEMHAEVLKREIGIKVTSVPFALRAIDALNSLGSEKYPLKEHEAKKAANVFLDGLQTLINGGTITDDYDKIDMVKRGKVITLSLRVEGFIRACARKGYRVIPTIIGVPSDDDVYFDETVQNGKLFYVKRDARHNIDRKITAERIDSGYFKEFICRLQIDEIKPGGQTIMTCDTVSNGFVLEAHAASEYGFYRIDKKWNGEENKYDKTVYDGKGGRAKEFATGTIWYRWTNDMVEKTVLRHAFKRIKEALPELDRTFYAFDNDTIINETVTPPEKPIEMPKVEIKGEDVDMKNLTQEQKEEGEQTKDMYTHNPKMATDDASAIMTAFYEGNKPWQEIVNEDYAKVYALSRFDVTLKTIQPLIDEIKGGVK